MIRYRDGYEGQLATTVHFQLPAALHPAEEISTEFLRLTPEGLLTIRRAYAWDYASGPTLDFRFFPGYKKTRVPSLVHDALCQLINLGLMLSVDDARKHADKFFYYLLRQRKFWKPRAKLWYRGVRIGAQVPGKPKPILTAE